MYIYIYLLLIFLNSFINNELNIHINLERIDILKFLLKTFSVNLSMYLLEISFLSVDTVLESFSCKH